MQSFEYLLACPRCRGPLRALHCDACRAQYDAPAGIPDDASVLEMGCGTGQLSLFLAGAGRLVIGADLTRVALELAQGAANRFGVGGVRFVETDVHAPGLRKEGFDVVVCNGVLHHTPDPRASFAALSGLV